MVTASANSSPSMRRSALGAGGTPALSSGVVVWYWRSLSMLTTSAPFLCHVGSGWISYITSFTLREIVQGPVQYVANLPQGE